jgi:hypothetical protein
MKRITFFDDKLVVEVPDYYEYTTNEYYTLVLYQSKYKAYTIKFIVIDSNENNQNKIFYENIISKGYIKKYSDDKYYNVYNHELNVENDELFITSFEIIFKNYYINIRVNLLEELDKDDNKKLIKYIDNIISTININI